MPKKPNETATPETPVPKPKKPRAESPETVAMRALRERRQLQERLDKERERHTARVAELLGAISAHATKCQQLPDKARSMVEQFQPEHAPGEPRFFLMNVEEARAAGHIETEYSDDWRTVLLERVPSGGIRQVGVDGGEPEDQTFTRDWSWVVGELNRVAGE